MADPILTLVETTLIPILSDIFRGFVADPADYKKPTSHLYTELSTRGVFTVLDSGYTTTYKVTDIPDSDYQLVLDINRFTFALRIVPQAKFENTARTNYISFSRDDRIGMYVYGVKANGEGPPVSGTSLNKMMMMVCKAMRIPNVYISDSAGIRCHWNKDIELEHFSILRVMAGKPTFYESLKGHFWDVAKAQEEKRLLQGLLEPGEKALIERYLASLTNTSIEAGDCEKVKAIVTKGYEALKAIRGGKPELFRYVATPCENGGSRSTRKRRRRRTHRRR